MLRRNPNWGLPIESATSLRTIVIKNNVRDCGILHTPCVKYFTLTILKSRDIIVMQIRLLDVRFVTYITEGPVHLAPI